MEKHGHLKLLSIPNEEKNAISKHMNKEVKGFLVEQTIDKRSFGKDVSQKSAIMIYDESGGIAEKSIEKNTLKLIDRLTEQ